MQDIVHCFFYGTFTFINMEACYNLNFLIIFQFILDNPLCSFLLYSRTFIFCFREKLTHVLYLSKTGWISTFVYYSANPFSKWLFTKKIGGLIKCILYRPFLVIAKDYNIHFPSFLIKTKFWELVTLAQNDRFLD